MEEGKIYIRVKNGRKLQRGILSLFDVFGFWVDFSREVIWKMWSLDLRKESEAKHKELQTKRVYLDKLIILFNHSIYVWSSFFSYLPMFNKIKFN